MKQTEANVSTLAAIYVLGIMVILYWPATRAFKVGGLRFLRIGRVQVSFCYCRNHWGDAVSRYTYDVYIYRPGNDEYQTGILVSTIRFTSWRCARAYACQHLGRNDGSRLQVNRFSKLGGIFPDLYNAGSCADRVHYLVIERRGNNRAKSTSLRHFVT